MEGLGRQLRPLRSQVNLRDMTIVITLPHFIEHEAERITELFERQGIDRLHLRKPEADPAEVERLIREIPEKYYPQISIHDFHELAEQYKLGGIHLTGRRPIPPQSWQGLLSTSCHSLEELALKIKEDYTYLTLSPIFDSISKVGYHSAFTREQLLKARSEGLIDAHVLALGGVTFARLPEVEDSGFGGAMILGDAWR